MKKRTRKKYKKSSSEEGESSTQYLKNNSVTN